MRALATTTVLALAALLAACADADPATEVDASTDLGASDAGETCTSSFLPTADLLGNAAPPAGTADPRATELVIYELQARSANACDPAVGSPEQRRACEAKVAPDVTYRADGPQCAPAEIARLERIRLGTLDDLITDTLDPREAISLRYIRERVGANVVWMMPLFPNNDRWNLPTPCDNLGSPYAVRDYMHVRASLSRACIEAGLTEFDPARPETANAEPCWGDDAFDAVLADAERRGVQVFLDVAFNHVGHNYLLYDTLGAVPLAERYEAGASSDTLWDFDLTYDEALLYPEVLDSPEELRAFAAENPDAGADLAALRERCPQLDAHALVGAFGAWRLAFQDERRSFSCDERFLEYQLPGFYSSRTTQGAARDVADMQSEYGWNDVKFLHHTESGLGQREAWRVREYFFRVMNHWVSRGVDGFRLDHATDGFSGLSPETWRYIMAKTEYYAALRGQDAPIYLAEEFHDQWGMAPHSDIMTEGYLFGMLNRGGAFDTTSVRRVLSEAHRFLGDVHVMAALENHDELRLVNDTPLDRTSGRGAWALGASIWSTPMMLVGQEWGESQRLEFRRAHVLPGRFETDPDELAAQDASIAAYRDLIQVRTSDEGAPLRATGRRFVHDDTQSALALLKWNDEGDVWLLLHNLFPAGTSLGWTIPGEVSAGLRLDACEEYRWVDVFSDTTAIGCSTPEDWARGTSTWMSGETPYRWLRLESCGGA